MTTAPRISVLMAARNAVPFLDEAIRSVRAQSFRDFEFLIADDGSDDATPAILAAHATEDQRIRLWHHPQSRGLTACLNHLFEFARGELIARMDADDVSLPPRFERQAARFDADPSLGVLGTWTRTILADGELHDERSFPDNPEWIRRQLRAGRNMLTHGSLMMRRQVLSGLPRPIWRFRYGQDFDLHLRLIDTVRYGIQPELLYAYRSHTDNMCASALSVRTQLNQLIRECDRVRRAGEPEPDWASREAEILKAVPAAVPGALGSYIAARRYLLEGDLPRARHELREAMVEPGFRWKSRMLLLLSYLPASAQLLERRPWCRDPLAPFIRTARRRALRHGS